MTKKYDIMEEFEKTDGINFDLVKQFIEDANNDDEKKQALIDYLTELDNDHTFNDKLFESFDYYDLLAKYEAIQEAVE